MRNRKGKIAGMILALMLAAVPFGDDEVLAANGWEEDLNGSGISTTTSQTDASVQITMGGKRIEGTLNAANASANPDEAGKVLTEIATITVVNTDGYTVAVSGNANLTGERDSSHTIPSVSTAKTLGSMSNEWGYYGVLGDTEASWNPSTNFKAMTSGQQTVGTGGAATSNVTKTVTLFYGARVNDSVAEDFYGNTVTLSVVAQPRTVTTTFATFDGATTMQEMTAAKCEKANVNDTKLLTDTRDNKKYWVTKLLDGNCWMSQNLDLDLSTSVTLTNEDSDVVNDWTPGQDTQTNVTVGSTDNVETYSWDPGQYVINMPTGDTGCGSNATGLSGCSMFADVTGWTVSDDPNFYKNNGGSPVNASTKTYDAHYLVGNYYQWNAATAGTGGMIRNYATAVGSICPKGWKLPSSAIDANTIAKGTYAYLLQQYGLVTAWNTGSLTGTSGVNGNTYNIALSPLFGVRGGRVIPGLGEPFQGAGSYGYYWSSRAWSGASSTYYLYLSTSINPSNTFVRYAGWSLRCLVPTS